MKKDEVIALIQKKAHEFRIDPNLVLAIAFVESNFDPFASRFEPGFRWFFKTKEYARRNNQSEVTETTLQAMSHGVLQIMGANAREHGFEEPLGKLYVPEIALHYGLIYLRKLLDRYQNVTDAISSYNQGSPRKDGEGVYLNNSYVLKVQTALKNRPWAQYLTNA